MKKAQWIVKWPEVSRTGNYLSGWIQEQTFAAWAYSQRAAVRFESRRAAQAVCDGWSPRTTRPRVVRLIPRRAS